MAFAAALFGAAFLAGAFFVTPPPGALAVASFGAVFFAAVAAFALAAFALVPGATFFLAGTSCLVLVEAAALGVAFLASVFFTGLPHISLYATKMGESCLLSLRLFLDRVGFLGSSALDWSVYQQERH